MSRIITKDRQTLLDVQLMACGTLEGVIETCALNDICLTDEIEDGREIEVATIGKNKVVNTYINKGYSPATAVIASVMPDGVGYMAVGVDFVVS